ncbi:MAG TPA: carboxypeptidase regulatory-like domain-containing protein, partial [Gemmatimonadaceae bacterium]|nr:carboxypeptidase regulatory-like domain-containing protein [Gemmatimonadaceae bacterium]
RLRNAICGKPEKGDSSTLVIGTVRDASSGAPAPGVTVRGEWTEYAFTPKGVNRRVPRILATTGDNGWFAMCNVPIAGTLALIASKGADSTDLLEIEIPPEGLLRRELYLGQHHTIVASESAQPTSSFAPSPRSIHLGDGTVTGMVVNVQGFPLKGALVSILDGPEARSNDAGEFVINNAPVGSRMLEVRALGYLPERRRVDVVNRTAYSRVILHTLQSVLDTVKVSATRLRSRDRSGFIERVRSGPGRYLTSKEIAKRPATFTSDLFRTISGVRIGFATDTLASDMVIAVSPDDMKTSDRRVLMRGIAGDWCAPVIYIDGLAMPGLGADEIDAWLQPKDVEGIEIYSEATVPAQFQKWRGGCGSVMIWKKK